ncbi:hypothetical protein [Nostoc sp. 'Peltigera membranacea cyanobiont' 232]|uniref:hypothetical protein n=1 Tax=Nostoc sp. 'Peltigera membranacea cyanobiont' 232 TaxID=2014531 RepID=UPI001CB91785|nr:hypothetical protein [Nostoc sp. 'Peltigera membranacea cyanobiont' 232]
MKIRDILSLVAIHADQRYRPNPGETHPRISHHTSQSLCLCRGAGEQGRLQCALILSFLPLCSIKRLKLVRNAGITSGNFSAKNHHLSC